MKPVHSPQAEVRSRENHKQRLRLHWRFLRLPLHLRLLSLCIARVK